MTLGDVSGDEEETWRGTGWNKRRTISDHRIALLTCHSPAPLATRVDVLPFALAALMWITGVRVCVFAAE